MISDFKDIRKTGLFIGFMPFLIGQALKSYKAYIDMEDENEEENTCDCENCRKERDDNKN